MPTTPSYPLDDVSSPSGGVILKSSNGVEFKVYKNILALASPFFREMFALPQPAEIIASSTGSSSSSLGLPLIEVPEHSSTLDILLRLVYPVPPPSLPGMSTSGVLVDPRELVKGIDPLLTAALKYDMPLVVKELCAKLSCAANSTLPDGSVVDDTLGLRVYALACRLRMKDEARAAAHAALSGRVTGVFLDDLRNISAAQYFHLIQFHSKIVRAVESIIVTRGLPRTYSGLISCSRCESRFSNRRDCAAWWIDFVDRARPILRESPKSNKVFSMQFLESTFREATCCGSDECAHVHGKWQNMSQFIKETIDRAIAANDIDLSEV